MKNNDIFNQKENPYIKPVSSGGYETLLLILVRLIHRESKVLDIGCGIGTIGEFLKNKTNCCVYGIDIDEKAVTIAKKKIDYAQVVDIAREEIPYKLNFDVIILADVIEHLSNPASLFPKIDKIINKSTTVIVSVPNVAYFKIRASLLFGNWNYKDSGILDRTHLRFFTYKTLSEFIKNIEYEIKDTYFTHGLQTHSVYKLNFVRFLSDKITSLFPTLFARQFVLVLKK